MPASEISSGTFSLDDLWPGDTELIRERLISALDSPSHLSPRSNMHSNADQDRPIATLFSILENALLAQLARPLVLHPAVAFAVRSLAGACRVSEVVDRVGLSSRRFIEVFHHQIGLTPKVFQRVCRFQRALRTLHNGAAPDLADLALNCGYYDQPHFINDFRTFSGMTPLEYLTVATPHLNHVPLN
jgi:AraC-like DNA-binding protein